MAAYPISVLGFGDNVVDKYEHIKTMYPGGNAVNFAVFAKKLGVDRSAYMGIFGSDEEAEHVIASLEDEGVELLRCQQVLGVNGAARVTVDETEDRIFLGSNEGGIRGDMRYVIDRFAAEYVSGFDLVHSGNYCFTERELPKIKAAGVPISFDFSDDSTDEYFEQIAPFVTYAFMSMGDASLEDIKAKLEWVKALGPQIVCASRGSKGSVAYDGENFYEQGIKPVAPEEAQRRYGGRRFTADGVFGHLSFQEEGRRVRRGRNSRELGLRCRFCSADLQDRGQLGPPAGLRELVFCRGGVSWGAPHCVGSQDVRSCLRGRILLCRCLPESGSPGLHPRGPLRSASRGAS